MMRVGVYLEGLENALRSSYVSAPSPVLTWEASLLIRPGKWWTPHYGWSEFGAVAVFVLLATGSIGLGIYRGYAEHETLILFVGSLELAILLLFTATLGWSLATVRERARRDFPQSPPDS